MTLSTIIRLTTDTRPSDTFTTYRVSTMKNILKITLARTTNGRIRSLNRVVRTKHNNVKVIARTKVSLLTSRCEAKQFFVQEVDKPPLG